MSKEQNKKVFNVSVEENPTCPCCGCQTSYDVEFYSSSEYGVGIFTTEHGALSLRVCEKCGCVYTNDFISWREKWKNKKSHLHRRKKYTEEAYE
jgi:hypothetical protein